MLDPTQRWEQRYKFPFVKLKTDSGLRGKLNEITSGDRKWVTRIFSIFMLASVISSLIHEETKRYKALSVIQIIASILIILSTYWKKYNQSSAFYSLTALIVILASVSLDIFLKFIPHFHKENNIPDVFFSIFFLMVGPFIFGAASQSPFEPYALIQIASIAIGSYSLFSLNYEASMEDQSYIPVTILAFVITFVLVGLQFHILTGQYQSLITQQNLYELNLRDTKLEVDIASKMMNREYVVKVRYYLYQFIFIIYNIIDCP